jgi:hypothetical protein
MFSLSITGPYIPKKYFVFYINKEFKKRIEEKLNSDDVYQFVK